MGFLLLPDVPFRSLEGGQVVTVTFTPPDDEKWGVNGEVRRLGRTSHWIAGPAARG
jgi:hypothetical protein